MPSEAKSVLEEQLSSLGNPVQHKWIDGLDSHLPDDEDDIPDDAAPEDSRNDSWNEEFIHDITDTYGRLSLDEDGQLRFFGSQSNYHLIHDHVSTQDPQSPRIHMPVKMPRDGDTFNVPLELQEHLLVLYFLWQNPWVYVV
ncbi:hypothetical protein PC129_g25320 [Phytophthora cactorum]|uniref:Uncharacterized protein n=1 Tax=Phytophthora cactorum TaxID=29920 RepID=A0A8T1GTB2_9STRA|nr:hypothetical protein PC129_g25320 [Phytophthora cactorum]